MKYQAQMKKKFETYLREMYFNLDCFKESSYTRYILRGVLKDFIKDNIIKISSF